MLSFQCSHCKSEAASCYLKRCVDYYMQKPGLFNYYRCDSCGLIQLHPIPDNLADYYADYQVHASKNLLHEWFRLRLMTKGYYKLKEPNRRPRLIDYGCGDGWYIRQVKQRSNCMGFEPNPEHAVQLQKQLHVPIYSDLNRLLDEQSGQFDIVTMHFVVEHLSNLGEVLSLVSRLLTSGGLFYFFVPNIESREARIFRRKWHGLDPPRHLMFPTLSIVRAAAAQHGLSVEEVRYFSLPSSLAGSLSTVLVGRFSYLLFAALILPSVAIAGLWTDGNLAVTLRRT